VSTRKVDEGERFPLDRLSVSVERPTVLFFYPVALTGG
jgi:hypothetical protein